LRFGPLFISLPVAGIVFALGIDRGHEEHALAVRRPRTSRSFGGDRSDFLRISCQRGTGAIEVLHPDLSAAAIARRLENHALAVRRETNTIFARAGRRGQSLRLSATDRDDPQ